MFLAVDKCLDLLKQCQRIRALNRRFYIVSKVDAMKIERKVSLLFPCTRLPSFYCSPFPIFSLLHGLEAAFRSCEIKVKFKDVRAHCYCASLVRALFIRHARATLFSSACTESKTQQNIELMTFVTTRCANILVGCSVTSTFFSVDRFLS